MKLTPAQTERVLVATAQSIGNWIAELEEIEARCPACPHRTSHLLNVMRQAQMSLRHMLPDEPGSEP